MPSIEQNLERIANALEILASNSKFLSGLSSKAQRETEAPAPVPKPAPVAAPAAKAEQPVDFMAPAGAPAPQDKIVKPGSLPAPDDREGIKAELERRKIAYNPRLQTKTLYEILMGETQPVEMSAVAKEDALASAAATAGKPRPTPAGPVAVTPVAPVVKITADDVRAALKQFGHVYGNDKALAMLNPFGVQNVTQLAEAGRLEEFMAALKTKGAEYDASAKK